MIFQSAEAMFEHILPAKALVYFILFNIGGNNDTAKEQCKTVIPIIEINIKGRLLRKSNNGR